MLCMSILNEMDFSNGYNGVNMIGVKEKEEGVEEWGGERRVKG